jgi:hypothetical protein
MSEPLAVTLAYRRRKPVTYVASHLTGSITWFLIWSSPTEFLGRLNAA